MGIEVRGLSEIQKNLTSQRTLVLKATTQALEKIGQEGTTIIKGNSPTISGRLRGSFGYTISGNVEAPEAFEADDKVKPISDKQSVIIGTNVVYGPSVEYRSQTGSKGFMQRSFNQLRQVAAAIAAQTIKREVG